MNVCYTLFTIVILIISCKNSTQSCSEEVSTNGETVVWRSTEEKLNITSDPKCYFQEKVVTRSCVNNTWVPELSKLSPCDIKNEQKNYCPPGYSPIFRNSTEYCYEISEPSRWDYPCLKSGGASVLTEFSTDEVQYLFKKLKQTYNFQYYWLPAHRQKSFNPIVWSTPGPNWGKDFPVHSSLNKQVSFLKNCVVIDVYNSIITTEDCNLLFPSLCIFIAEQQYPAECPTGYQTFRFLAETRSCYSIEFSETPAGLTYDEFLNSKCTTPLNAMDDFELISFLYQKIVTSYNVSAQDWCWFQNTMLDQNTTDKNTSQNTDDSMNTEKKGIINKFGMIETLNKTSNLSCMACETKIIESLPEIILDYNQYDLYMYLSVYLPSGLWKYNNDDTGVRCFSNGKGFVKNVPLKEYTDNNTVKTAEDEFSVNKTVYVINTITDRMAQYWCEGHTFNLSLISTKIVLANPLGDSEHVFSLCISTNYSYVYNDYEFPVLINVTTALKRIFNANNVVIMDILACDGNEITLLAHLYISVSSNGEDFSDNLHLTFNTTEQKAKNDLINYNMTFVSISSSLYCMPVISEDGLFWELTEVGQIVAPTQFCLQENGLPVKRTCLGSYLIGATWGPIEGTCDVNYEASETTTFLYNFVKGKMLNNNSRFLTDGLAFVLDDLDIIIPADIYYLSMSLKQVSVEAQTNETYLETGDLENIVWAVNRLMIMNSDYLKLAQTLNSTNVILDSVTDIIESIAFLNTSGDLGRSNRHPDGFYQLAIQPQFISQISFPFINNVTGLALIKHNDSNFFTDMLLKPLYANTTVEDLLTIENLEIATWVPTYILENLILSSNRTFYENIYSFNVIINVFYNDAIFQQVHKKQHMTNSRIVEISIPGYLTKCLKRAIPLIFHEDNSTDSHNFCGYWDFQYDINNSVPGNWDRRGCYQDRKLDKYIVCRCFHLTHFAQLISTGNIDFSNLTQANHSRALNLISLIGSFLSLLGISGIFITAIIFTAWRQKAGTKVLLQLSTAIAIPLVIMIIFSLDDDIFIEIQGFIIVANNMKYVCITLGALLHYSILAGFVWMLIAAVLQFVRYVQVIGVMRPSKFMMKITIIGWGAPLIPVIALLIADMNGYIPNPANKNSRPICYPKGNNFLLSILFPISVIVIINVVLFISVIISISKGPDGKLRTLDISLIKAQLRLSILLFFLLGLTWIFGLLSFSQNLLWSYMFCLTSTLQGFVLFVYFVICDPSTRGLWATLIKPTLRNSLSARESITSISKN